ncbi:PREDICTED: probable inactive lysine-specific demethylase JMJ19 [Camelina sativa]|uniref:Probable inactive lysine-specific demethylase JMJ19 n=1 Tax=Camelina sativa TaxID=90675 RepID=A0ABM0YTA0_CAMSA|nr:PREDICTED: probable inactive lysine-specific demethylase JMJ19 [Camelina sativa]XP_010505548.1 PREDICTED: probable inactive lysine-specific demethylase JMJ19 [Camelina sativa]
MGVEAVPTYLKSGNMDIISTPPGFVSQTSFVLKNVRRDEDSSMSVSRQEQTTTEEDMFLTNRPWIVHDHTLPSSEASKAKQPEVRLRRRLKVSETEVLEEGPVFNPTEEEFGDTLSYIASLRERAEPYGICCVVPPPSWKPPCLLKEMEIWDDSTFFPQVQLFDGIHTENPKIKKELDADSDDATSEEVKFCKIERGPGHTLKSFKSFADSYKKSHFSMKDEVLGSKNPSPSPQLEELTVADVEKEYRQLVESPLVEIGVLYGNDIDTSTFGSGFPLSEPSESCKYSTSGWNLNNTPKLPGSLLSLEDCESICVPRLSVGMCLSSQFWKSEKERLYSLCYLHEGAPRVWYSVAGCHQSKFQATMKNLIPEMSGEQPKKSFDPVMIMSPYQLSMEGIPVTRCVQNPGQYVILFPGSYYSAFDCGFNCLEKANFAPLDWLPHGNIAVRLNEEKSKKSLISYDKLLLSASREAVKYLKEYALSKKNPACYARWNDSCGKEGVFSNIVKSRVREETRRREFLSGSLESQRMDKSYDAVSKRECCVCLGDLYLSAVKCSCSADRYSCLSHMRKLCACPFDRKSFLYRYTVDELNILVEALEGKKLSSMFRWTGIEQRYCAYPAATTRSSQPEEAKGKETDEVTRCNITRKDVAAGTREPTRGKARSMAEILKVKKGSNDAMEPLKSCSKKSKRPCDDDSSDVDTTKKQKQG